MTKANRRARARAIYPTSNELREKFIQEAESFLGYTAPLNQPDMFSIGIGQPGIAWNGAFVDYCAAKIGLQMTSNVLTNVSLASYIRSNRMHFRPQRGDLVFLQTPTDESTAPFNQPHVGVITDVSAWKQHGMFQCIEAQTSTGLPKGTALRNGVYRRNRYAYDVIGFARPNFKRTEKRIPDPASAELLTKLTVKASILRPGLKHPQVTVLQIALSKVNGLRGVPRGEFDHKTRSSFANFQRTIGYVGSAADGIPDLQSLTRLAELTGDFIPTA